MSAHDVSSICELGSTGETGSFTRQECSLIWKLSDFYGLSASLCLAAHNGQDCVILSDDDKSTGHWAWILVKTVGLCQVSHGRHCFDFASVQDALLTIGNTLALETEAAAFASMQDKVERSERALAVQNRRRAFTVV
jgi:hypothetical protein